MADHASLKRLDALAADTVTDTEYTSMLSELFYSTMETVEAVASAGARTALHQRTWQRFQAMAEQAPELQQMQAYRDRIRAAYKVLEAVLPLVIKDQDTQRHVWRELAQRIRILRDGADPGV